MNVNERIRGVLREGPATTGEIATELEGVEYHGIRARLQTMLKRGAVIGTKIVRDPEWEGQPGPRTTTLWTLREG